MMQPPPHHSSRDQQQRPMKKKEAAEEEEPERTQNRTMFLSVPTPAPAGGAAAAARQPASSSNTTSTPSITTTTSSRTTCGASVKTRRAEKWVLILGLVGATLLFVNLTFLDIRTQSFFGGGQQPGSQGATTARTKQDRTIGITPNNNNITITNVMTMTMTMTPTPKKHDWNKSRPLADDGIKTTQDTKEELPYLVMFVGPGKTATTTLQSALTILERKGILAQDNYVYLGRRSNRHKPTWSPLVQAMIPAHKRYCGTNYTDCWNKYWDGAREEIEDLALKQQNAIVYEEILALFVKYPDIHALQQLIEGKFQLVIVVGYRRLFSWLPSWKNQMEKKFDSDWPEKQQKQQKRDPHANLNASSFLAAPLVGMMELALNRKRPTRAQPFFTAEAYSPAQSHGGWTVDVLNRFQSWNAHSNIRIFNMHHRQGDVISHFLCDILPQSNHSCAAASLVADAMKQAEENPSVNMDFSLVAVEAMDRDLLDPNKVTRQEAVTFIREECFEKNKKALFPLPMECLDQESEQVLLNKSLQIEGELVANFSDTSPHLKEFWTRDEEERHRESFRKSTAKFCSVNLTAVFAHPLWLGCLAEIKNKKATKRTSSKQSTK